MPEAKRSEEVPSETAFSVVGIGASAGGIEACSTLLAALPTDISAAFVVIQHIAADEPSMLSEVLARASDFPTVEAQENQTVQPGHVYVIPPNTVMTMAGGKLRLATRPPNQAPFHPIDAFSNRWQQTAPTEQ